MFNKCQYRSDLDSRLSLAFVFGRIGLFVVRVESVELLDLLLSTANICIESIVPVQYPAHKWHSSR